MHHWQNFILIEPHSEDAYVYDERELRLTNLKALWEELGFDPHVGWLPFFLDWSFEHQFNSTSRTLSEAIGKWVLLM